MGKEEPFVPGIDPGLRKWLVMRAATRELKKKSGSKILITCECSYKYKQYWLGTVLAGAQKDGSVLCQMSSTQAFTKDQFESLLLAKDMINPEVLASRVIDQRNDVYLNILLKSSFNINSPIGRGRNTLLHIAVRRGDLKKVTILLEHGASVRAVDSHGRTPLYAAIQTPSMFQSIDIIRKLIEYKSSLNNSDNNGVTLLHRAVIVGNEEIIKIILKQNRSLTSLSKLDRRDKLPVDYATKFYDNFMDWCYHMCNKRQNQNMWARVVARDFVANMFRMVDPQCVVCKRKLRQCSTLKLENYRYYIFTKLLCNCIILLL